MQYLTEPSVREMFAYLVIISGIIVSLLSALLSPLIVGDLIRTWKARRDNE